MKTKTLYRNARTKRLCRRDDPEAEALEVPTKRLRLVAGRLYRFEAGRRYAVEQGRPYELVRADDGALHALRLKPVRPGTPEESPLFIPSSP